MGLDEKLSTRKGSLGSPTSHLYTNKKSPNHKLQKDGIENPKSKWSPEGPSSIYPDAAYPFSIDLTGPLPVINVMMQEYPTPRYEKDFSKEKLFHKLIREAPKVPVVKLNSDYQGCLTPEEVLLEDKADLNEELLEEGKRFIRRNFFAIIFAHLVALAFLLAVKPIQALLLRTGSIHRKETTLKRYLRFILGIKTLYEVDLSTATSPTNCELQGVRQAQEKAAKNFRIFAPPPMESLKLDKTEEELLREFKKDLVLLEQVDCSEESVKNMERIYTTVNPEVPLSQYDLAIAQFTFFGFITLFPKVFGIFESEKKFPQGLNGFVHIWAVLGKRLGLEDRFNLCLQKNFDQETNNKIFQEVFLFSFKIGDETLIKLWKSMTSGSYKYFYFFRTKALIHFMLRNVAKISECSNVLSIMNFNEKLSYYFYNFIVSWVLRFWLTRSMMNLLSRAIFYLGFKFYLGRMKKVAYGYDCNLVNVKVAANESVKTISS